MAGAGELTRTPPRIRLPLFMTWDNRIRWGWAMYAFAVAIYLTTNHFPIRSPALLPMTAVDLATPFVPWTVWLYVSEYLFFALVYLCTRRLDSINRYFYAFLFVQIASCTVFWLLPTTYPRDLFPLPADLDAVTAGVFTVLRATDSPHNCLPSLHVSSVYLSVFLYLEEVRERPRTFWAFLAWGTVISLSTLTTKQHYLADVVAGLGLGGLAFWLFFRSPWIGYVAAPPAGGGAQAKR